MTGSLPLRRLLRVREDTNRPDLEVLSVYREHGVVPKSSRGDNHNKTPDDLSRYLHVRPGDLVVNKMKAWSGSVGVSSHEGIVSGDYLVCGVRRDLNPRYLHHVLRSSWFIAEMRIRSRGVRPSQERLYWDDLAGIVIPVMPLMQQRRIADLLDDQVARLDAAAAGTRALHKRFEERVDSLWADAYRGCLDQGSLVPLRRLLRSIVDGPFGSSLTSAHYTDAGVRVIRLGNLGLAQFRDGDAAYISEAYGRELRQHAVQPGDVLMAGLGDERWPLGRAVVAPEHLGPAIVKADCYRLRPVAGVDPRYLAVALSAPQSRESIRQLARGSTRARLNTEVAREVPVARVGPDQQRPVVIAVEQAQSALRSQDLTCGQILGLTEERKRALITACVTGEFDVSSASDRAGAAALSGSGG